MSYTTLGTDDEQLRIQITDARSYEVSVATDDTDYSIVVLDDTTANLTVLSVAGDPFTTTDARNSISVSGDLSYNSSTGVISYTEHASTDELVEGTENLYYTDARVQAVIDTNTADYATVAYVDSAEADAVTTANAYTDTRETAITTAYQAYADQAETDAVSTANAYTDGRETAITGAYETYTDNAVANLVDSAPGALDTLNELAAALGDDPNFATTITNSLALKANSADLSTVATTGEYSDLLNKPTIPTNNNELINGAGYITDYTVTEADVTQHQSALTITESQISDLDHYTSTDFDTDFGNKGASDLSYDNTDSTLSSTNVKGALDELDAEKLNIADMTATLRLYATDTSSGVSTYYLAVSDIDDPDYDTTPVDVAIGPVTGDDQLVGAVVSAAGVLTGNPGVINITTVGNIRKTSGGSSQNSGFYFTILHRDSGGTETLMGTSSSTPPIDSASYEEFFADCLLTNPISFTSTDRIVIKYYSDGWTGGAPEYEFQFGGTSPVRTNLPVPVTLVTRDQDASEVQTDTSNFTTRLSGADTTVQAALETLDTAPVDGGSY